VGVVLLTALEAVAYVCAPASAHAFVGGALLGAGSAAAITVAATVSVKGRRPARRRAAREPSLLESVSETEHFPMEALRPLLLRGGAPSLNRLYLAWAFTRQGYRPEWIRRHLDLPGDVTQVLDGQHRTTAPRR
jgi:hypothetical protein